ncbi:hypothetical protein [Shewanella sp.]|uniref:hypothetical protein n=1 Tax=Shewanella sp. TaxID=50422 RepID=UPI003F39E927
MTIQFIDALLQAYKGVELSAWDNLRLLLSECAHHQHQAYGFEVCYSANAAVPTDATASTIAQSHYWVQIENIWLDCGRTNAYCASIVRLSPEQLNLAHTKVRCDCARLTQEQLALLCMQNAHFDHC